MQDGVCKPIIQIIIEEALSALGPEGQVVIVVQEGQQGSFDYRALLIFSSFLPRIAFVFDIIYPASFVS